MTVPRAGLVAVVLAMQVSIAVAVPVKIRLCLAEQAPSASPAAGGGGLVSPRLRAAAQGLDVVIEPYEAPRARCLQDSRQGRADALIGVFAPDRLTWLAYPMRNGLPAAERSIASIRVSVYRRVGSRVEWDGQRLTGLAGLPLGLRFGYFYGSGVDALGVPLDDRAMSSEQLIAKLIKGRVGAALLTDEAAGHVAKLPPGQIESLPQLYGSMPLFFIVTRDFERANNQLVQRLWTNLAATPAR